MSNQISLTPFGTIPDAIWFEEKRFIGKIQIPLPGSEIGDALIYDASHEWKLFLPLAWIREVELHGQRKGYFKMWFDKKHGLHIEDEIREEQYW